MRFWVNTLHGTWTLRVRCVGLLLQGSQRLLVFGDMPCLCVLRLGAVL